MFLAVVPGGPTGTPLTLTFVPWFVVDGAVAAAEIEASVAPSFTAVVVLFTVVGLVTTRRQVPGTATELRYTFRAVVPVGPRGSVRSAEWMPSIVVTIGDISLGRLSPPADTNVTFHVWGPVSNNPAVALSNAPGGGTTISETTT